MSAETVCRVAEQQQLLMRYLRDPFRLIRIDRMPVNNAGGKIEQEIGDPAVFLEIDFRSAHVSLFTAVALQNSSVRH